MKLAEPAGHHSVPEAARALAEMSAADRQRAQLLARARADGLRTIGWEDLLQEAIIRILDGGRRWPVDVPVIAFLAQTMRSIASDHRRRDAIYEDMDTDAANHEAARAILDDQIDAAGRIARVHAHFEGDTAVERLIEGLIAGENAAETQRRAGLSAQMYDAARKRYWRGIAKLNGEQQ